MHMIIDTILDYTADYIPLFPFTQVELNKKRQATRKKLEAFIHRYCFQKLIGTACVTDKDSGAELPVYITKSLLTKPLYLSVYVGEGFEARCLAEAEVQGIEGTNPDSLALLEFPKGIYHTSVREYAEPQGALFIERLDAYARQKCRGGGSILVQAVAEIAICHGLGVKIALTAAGDSHGFYVAACRMTSDNPKQDEAMLTAFQNAKTGKPCPEFGGVSMYCKKEADDFWKEKIMARPVLFISSENRTPSQ